jgi:hypothetical protein
VKDTGSPPACGKPDEKDESIREDQPKQQRKRGWIVFYDPRVEESAKAGQHDQSLRHRRSILRCFASAVVAFVTSSLQRI